ncbi:MAG: imidazole glycerol phosphate synthase subunit HisH [Deltaproteobacteria bacterium]|nr:imidazole glycerol phosphate synthase subunit HisH [Deltaproteobacteria bacterium]
MVKRITIVDYGVGNLRSVANAFAAVGAETQVCGTAAEIARAEALVLPGVGAFGEAMRRLHVRGLREALDERALGAKVPVLGLCLGMQLFATKSFEHGEHAGLGWIPGEVLPLERQHVGWNDVGAETFYFVHGFHFVPADPRHVVATADFDGPVTAIVQKDHIRGMQFHPEKSQRAGLALLKAFAC